jgi:diguanylate cyclase (GGDEF)-like protein/PAS domain S-box-containing protein
VKSYLIALLLVVFSQGAVYAEELKEAIPVQPDSSGAALELTPDEQKWLAQHNSIRIAYDGSLPPYSFVNNLGKIDGIAVEIMAILSQRLGISYKVHPDSNWSSLYKAAAKKKVDMVATMVNRPDRTEWFRFTKPYLTKSLVIVTKRDNTSIHNRNEIADKKIAVAKGYQYGEQVFNEFPSITRVKVNTMLDGLLEVDKGQVDAAILFLGTANYLQAKHQLDNLKIAAFYDRNSANESIAVRKDWPIFVSILQKGLDSLTEEEVQKIFAKWVVGGGIPTAEAVKSEPQAPSQPQVKEPPKTVVEVEQKPAEFSIQKTEIEPSKDTIEIGKMAVFLLIVLALFLLWLTQIRKQKKLQIKAKNEMMMSARNLQSTHNDAMHLTIEPSAQMNMDDVPKPDTGTHSEPVIDINPAVDINIDHLRVENKVPPEFIPDETIKYQRDGKSQFSYVSPAVTSLLGYSESDFMQNYRNYLTDNPINQHLDYHIEACMQGRPSEPYQIEVYDAGQGIRWLEVTDSPIYDGQGHCIGVAGVMNDITTQKLYDKLSAKTSDSQTDESISQPKSLQEYILQAIQTANKNHQSFAIIYVALSHLRMLDGTLAPHAQNEVFSEAGKRLRATLRDTDAVVQMGVDRFTLILPETNSLAVGLIIEKIKKILQVPYLVGVESIVLDASLGSTLYPGNSSDPESLLNEAQILLPDDVPKSSKPSISKGDSLQDEDNLQLQEELVGVLDECKVSLRATSPHNINALNRHSQFSVHYQSRHDLKDYNIIGFEALIRWQHPQLGQLLPVNFVYLVEDIGLLDILTYWIIQQVSFQAVAWEKLGIRPKQMIVNLGDLAIKQAVEPSKIIAIIKETGAKPEWLVLSIAESVIAKNPDLVIPIITQLADAGLVMAIDNYGSDTTVPTLLKNIPAQIIEIDPAFIRALPNNTADAEALSHSMAMLHELGRTVVAKEVETEQQLEFLKAKGCDMIQGHLLSRPMPPKEAMELMKTLPDFAWYFVQK